MIIISAKLTTRTSQRTISHLQRWLWEGGSIIGCLDSDKKMIWWIESENVAFQRPTDDQSWHILASRITCKERDTINTRCALDSFCIAIVPPEKLDAIYISHVFPVSGDRICVDVTDRMKLTWRYTARSRHQNFQCALTLIWTVPLALQYVLSHTLIIGQTKCHL